MKLRTTLKAAAASKTEVRIFLGDASYSGVVVHLDWWTVVLRRTLERSSGPRYQDTAIRLRAVKSVTVL